MSAQGANQRSQTTQQQSGSQQTGLVRRSSSATLPSLWMDPGDFINPFALIRRMQDEMSRALGRGDNQAGVWAPAIELEQRDGNLVVQAELPGMEEGDVRVEINDDVLVIQGERRTEREEDDGGVRRTERRYGTFYRAVALPDGAKVADAKAELDRGVLRVIIPVEQARSNSRQIPVQASSSSRQGGQQSASTRESQQSGQSSQESGGRKEERAA